MPKGIDVGWKRSESIANKCKNTYFHSAVTTHIKRMGPEVVPSD